MILDYPQLYNYQTKFHHHHFTSPGSPHFTLQLLLFDGDHILDLNTTLKPEKITWENTLSISNNFDKN